MELYCPNCHNLYDITKSTLQQVLSDSPNEISSSSKNETSLQSEKKNNSDEESKIIAAFICFNCGNQEPIKNKTLILSKIAEQSNDFEDVSYYKNMINAPYLPRTRKYICPNKDCISHTKHDKREAVFFRIGDSYKIRYVCTACSYSWI